MIFDSISSLKFVVQYKLLYSGLVEDAGKWVSTSHSISNGAMKIAFQPSHYIVYGALDNKAHVDVLLFQS
jgi:hypothetical protein